MTEVDTAAPLDLAVIDHPAHNVAATTIPPTTMIAAVPTTTSAGTAVPLSDVVNGTEAPPAGRLDCTLTDAQISALVEYVRSIPSPDGGGAPPITVPGVSPDCIVLPPVPAGWTLYQIVVGDYLYELAGRFCTTPEELVAENAWADGVSSPLFPGQLISVPADNC